LLTSDLDSLSHTLLESARGALSVAQAGVVLIRDEKTNQLIPKAASGYKDNDAMKRIVYPLDKSLPGLVFGVRHSLRVDAIQFANDNALSIEDMLTYRQATGGRLPVSSWLIPVQSGNQSLGVLVLDNFDTPAAFKENDAALLLAVLLQQIALSLPKTDLK
jgi:hypothetical protein